MIVLLHRLSFGLMFLSALIMVVVTIERLIFCNVNLKSSQHAIDVVGTQVFFSGQIQGADLISNFLREVVSDQHQALNKEQRINVRNSFFISIQKSLNHRIWIIDTLVTAAPLMGLLGTIFGIVDTFLALSSSGMSDPAAVSAGIGTALYATALGISIALVGIFANNYLNDQIEKICENTKILILRL